MKILMVCLGNICRSPLAEGILQSKLGPEHQVDSAGTDSFHEGQSPDYRSMEIARKYGLDISNQKSRPLSADDFEEFDLIYAMDKSNFENILKLADSPEQKSKVRLILKSNPNSAIDEVPDPYYGSEEGFEYVYRLLDEATDFIAEEIQNS